MKVSDFLENDMPTFLLGAFYGRFELTNDDKYIYTYSSYKNGLIYSNKELCDKSKQDCVQQFNEICAPYTFWSKGVKRFPRANIVFSLENDLNLTKNNFFNRLNTKIYSSQFIYDSELTENKKMFIRGFSELRASIDRNRNFLTMDYVYNSVQESKRVRLLIDYLNVPVYVVNYNFREFQGDYVLGIRRETQFRFNLQWYVNFIGLINNYRKAVFEHNISYTEKKINGHIAYYKCEYPLPSSKITFENRVTYYANNVLGKKLTAEDFAKFRKLIGINSDDEEKFKRDGSIVDFVRYNTEDKCVCCCDDYDIKDRSYIDRKTGRYYFEIHHMISVGQTKELDDVDNLAKICPTCHRALKRGSATEQEQKILIRKILNHKQNILDFCKSYFDEKDFEQVIDKIWRSLK